MNRALVLLLIPILLLGACNDEKSPTKPEPEPHDYAGVFFIEYSLESSDCSFPMPPHETIITISITGNDITFGGTTGTWDEDLKRGYGTSTRTCIPIPTPPGCTSCFTYSFDITYSSTDRFEGTFDIVYDHSPECSADDCTAEYTITGERN